LRHLKPAAAHVGDYSQLFGALLSQGLDQMDRQPAVGPKPPDHDRRAIENIGDGIITTGKDFVRWHIYRPSSIDSNRLSMLKIFGCFRSFDGVRIFARIRERLSTVKKQGHNALQAMTMLFMDHVAS